MSQPAPLIKISTTDHIHPSLLLGDIPANTLKNSNILFINMPLRESARPTATPEGPLLMLTRLRDNFGCNVHLIDLNAYRIQDELWERRKAQGENIPWGRHKTFQEAEAHIREHVLKHGEPDLIGFSGKITTYRWQKELAKIVRNLFPDVFLVTGNGLATELRTHLFQYIPEFDGVAHSEGDDIVVKIVYDAVTIKKMGRQNAINSGKLKPYYLGLINDRHRFLYAGDRPLNLDILPHADLELLRSDVFGQDILANYLATPAWSRQANNSSATPWKDEDMVPKTTSVSSRGCPFGCKYCFRGSQGERKWGVRSAEHIMRELHQNIERYGIKFHGYPDDNFAVNLGRIKDIKNIVKWGTHTRLDEVAGLNDTTRGTAETMAGAGCVYIGFGPESASPPVLEAIGKGGHTLTNGMTPILVNGSSHEFPRSMVLGIQNALRNGIHSNCTWIFACPTEKLENLKETVLFIMWQLDYYTANGLPSDSVNTRMFTLTWYPGTTIINYERVRNELSRVFGLSFTKVPKNYSGVEYEPVFNAAFERYMLELDDATKILYGPSGEPLNFGDMPPDQFLLAREYIDSNQISRILDM